MADAWGGSWGSAWGVSWGAGVTPVTPTVSPAAGKAKRDRKKRWWQVDDRLYYGTREQIEAVMETFVETKAVQTTLKSKPAAQPVTAALPRRFDLSRQSVEPKVDWTGFYEELAKRDFEAAQVLVEILRRRREDEEDEDMLILLH